MLTAKEYYLWSRFICDTFSDADGNCKEECIFKNDNDCCAIDFWSCETDIDYLISKVEDFKNKYMKEHYSEALISWFKRRFPESSEQICDLLCPKFVFGEEIYECGQKFPSLCNVGDSGCWNKPLLLNVIPPEVSNITNN